AASAQGRGMQQRPFVTPSMMNVSMTRMNTTAMTPAMMTARTNALLQRDIRLDALVNRNLRMDIVGREIGHNPWWWGGNSWWGSMLGGWGGWGGGFGAVPIVVPSGAGAAVAQTPSGSKEDPARSALLLEQAVAERLANRRRAFDE